MYYGIKVEFIMDANYGIKVKFIMDANECIKVEVKRVLINEFKNSKVKCRIKNEL